MDRRVLHLTLHREWFDKIHSGEKKVEYRDKTEYWRRRLFETSVLSEGFRPREYDIIRFRNGYRKDSPVMEVEYLGVREEEDSFEIDLGEILKTENYRGKE